MTTLSPDRTLVVTPQRLVARIDVALELGSGTPRESVASAWRAAVADQPDLRPFLLGPVPLSASLAASRRTLLASVAVAAGLATFDTPRPVAVAAAQSFLRSVDAGVPDCGSWLGRVLGRLWAG
jgi:hypothetical protein